MHKTENRRTASVNCSTEEWRKQSTVFNLQDVEKYKYLINCAESFHSYLSNEQKHRSPASPCVSKGLGDFCVKVENSQPCHNF